MTSLSTNSFAESFSSGDHSIEFGAAVATASQDDLNSWIVANSGQQLGTATELSFSYIYRFGTSDYALVLRPSYFSQKNSGAISATLTGTSFMPMFRVYPLENTFIKFFLQIGMGMGTLTGSVSTPTARTDFTGTAFGAEAGIGADFCFYESHCLTIEGNLRYLPIVRSTTSGASGTLGNGLTALGELESNNSDVQNNMTGFKALLAYTFKF